MFERRLKIFLIVIFLMGMVLIGRLFAVQVVNHGYWTKLAAGLLTRPTITETTRGQILDIHGKPLAMDVACTDACVDYRAIMDKPDPNWVSEIATERVLARLGKDAGGAASAKRRALVAEETGHVLTDIKIMWATLAQLNPAVAGDARENPDAAMNEIRAGILQSVQQRRQWLLARNQQRDQNRAKSLWTRFLAGSTDPSGDSVGTLADETEPHVVLPDLDSDACNFLGKRAEQFPGLVLRASTHRKYPLKAVACHLLGRLSRVSASDLDQARRDNLDEFRQYHANDLVGREGIEALCEPLLRGSRGRIDVRISDQTEIARQDFVPGVDVQLSIDADLQKQVENMLQHVVEVDGHGQMLTPPEGVSMHAAAVVLDVKTNELRVLASNPGFDVNELQAHYTSLVSDTLNEPLRDRATSDECEPGSTIKPLIGLGAITQGILSSTDTIECTGYLYLPEIGPDGKTRRIKMPRGRCWVLSEYGDYLKEHNLDGSHHPIPPNHKHPTGFLTYADALERSCDIYFETLADRLGPAGINHWYNQFGLGRITGVGIYERPGLRPEMFKGQIASPRMNNCYAGMGEGTSWATAIQIANEAATIARGGIWMRPRLLSADTQAALDAVRPRTDGIPDRVDLHLSPDALEQARLGMVNVVDSGAGTGHIKHDPAIHVAAKTGTADTSILLMKTKDKDGRMVNVKMIPATPGGEATATPWYRSSDGKNVVHGWYMGFAPAEDPQIAFCVLVEYAGAGGGVSAAPIASQILEACSSAGYLHAVAAH